MVALRYIYYEAHLKKAQTLMMYNVNLIVWVINPSYMMNRLL